MELNPTCSFHPERAKDHVSCALQWLNASLASSHSPGPHRHPSYALSGKGWHQAWGLSNPRSCWASVTSKPRGLLERCSISYICSIVAQGWGWLPAGSLVASQPYLPPALTWAISTALSSTSVGPQNGPVLSKHVSTSFFMVLTPDHWGRSVLSIILQLDPPRHSSPLHPSTRYFRSPFEKSFPLGTLTNI